MSKLMIAATQKTQYFAKVEVVPWLHGRLAIKDKDPVLYGTQALQFQYEWLAQLVKTSENPPPMRELKILRQFSWLLEARQKQEVMQWIRQSSSGNASKFLPQLKNSEPEPEEYVAEDKKTDRAMVKVISEKATRASEPSSSSAAPKGKRPAKSVAKNADPSQVLASYFAKGKKSKSE